MKFYNKIFLLSSLISYILGKQDCSLEVNCNDCEFCGKNSGDYSKCNFSNIFCKNYDTEKYTFDSKFMDNYSGHFRSEGQINTICGNKDILLDETKDNINILDLKSNDNIPNYFHCDYYIKNEYYYKHKTDSVKLNIDIKSNNTDTDVKLKFEIYIIYDTSSGTKLTNMDDEHLRNSYAKISLDTITEMFILIDFYNINSNSNNDESLSIKLETDNPSIELRKIYIIIIIVSTVIILVIIGLFILYCYLKKRHALLFIEQTERERIEKEEKIKKNQKLIQQLFDTCLKPIKFNKNIFTNDCDNCTICLEPFEDKKSQVSISLCQHIFHYECIKKWIDENVFEPKCPNCNAKFLDSVVNPDKIEITNLRNSRIRIEGNNYDNLNQGSNSEDRLNVIRYNTIENNNNDNNQNSENKINNKSIEANEINDNINKEENHIKNTINE